MNLSYKERIARRLTAVTALIILLVFGIIYGVVYLTVIHAIDRDLKLETDKHRNQIFLVDGEIRFAHKDEWEEQEHTQLQINPIFIEIVDLEGNSMDRSPNLQNNHLSFYPDRAVSGEAWTLKAGSRELRQMQIPLINQGAKEGYLLVAKSFEDPRNTLSNLRSTLLLLYPLILISLFLTMRYHADQSIQPIRRIIQKANQITQSNLNERIPPTELNDEIGQLTDSINGLLSRLEQALLREKQFTSDASHELRTPLAVLRGTLEVLIRKMRTPAEYEGKIQESLKSIDRMTAIINQLLALARTENGISQIKEEVELITFCEEIADELTQQKDRKVRFESEVSAPIFVPCNEKSLRMIVQNLLENAIKYSSTGTDVILKIANQDAGAVIQVIDQGVGISPENLSKIFDPFYRQKSAVESMIPGSGLGLAIVKKLVEEGGLKITVESALGKGSTFSVIFPLRS
ncbi:ATP-binding protein [Algoriphagus sp.]|uniref:sensor histidine kinase n=1 Tax=Algoriphagus sp. TaxID=1872435 RepID=UPI0026121FD9|nr:ATP-binding protein [Algoriphagus sp.]